MTRVKDLIKELKDTEYYISVHDKNNRLGGGFVFQPEIELHKFEDCEILELESSETCDIVKVVVTPPPSKVIEKEEEEQDGVKTREESSRKSRKVSQKSRSKGTSSVSRKKASDR